MNAVDIKLSESSVSLISSNLQKKVQTVREATNAEMSSFTSHVFERAQQRVPTVTGALSASGNISEQNTDDVLKRVIGYGTSLTNPTTGRTTASYAVERHEVESPKNPESYKWLERTMLDSADEFLQRMASAISGGLND